MAEITRKDFQLQMKTFGEMNQKLSTIEENTKPDTEAESIKRGFLETIFEIRLNLSISSPNMSCVPLTDLNFILINKFYFFSFFSN